MERITVYKELRSTTVQTQSKFHFTPQVRAYRIDSIVLRNSQERPLSNFNFSLKYLPKEKGFPDGPRSNKFSIREAGGGGGGKKARLLLCL